MHTLGGSTHLANQRVTEWLLREKARKERSDPLQAPSQTLNITISRQFGAGGNTIAGLLAERLGSDWQVWNRGLIEEIARSGQVRAEMARSLDEKTRSWVDQMLYNLFGVPIMDEHSYRRHLTEVLLSLSSIGHQIIVGRGSNYILHQALHVRLWAPEVFRIENVMNAHQITREAAAKMVHEIDHERSAFLRTVFGHTGDEPEAFDLVLRSDTLGYPAVAGIIVTALNERKSQEKPLEHAVVQSTVR